MVVVVVVPIAAVVTVGLRLVVPVGGSVVVGVVVPVGGSALSVGMRGAVVAQWAQWVRVGATDVVLVVVAVVVGMGRQPLRLVAVAGGVVQWVRLVGGVRMLEPGLMVRMWVL